MECIPFPGHWAGNWQDRNGRLLEVVGQGKWLEVTLRPGPGHPPFPIPGLNGQFTEAMPAFLRQSEQLGLHLDVQAGDPAFFPRYLLALAVQVDQRLEPASLQAPANSLTLLPVVQDGLVESPSPTSMSWALPLLQFKRLDG